MSRFYAKFSEADDEIITFSTAKERDAWVNFQDEISVATKQTKENAAFRRVPLTTKEATYIIKSKDLILYHDKESDGTVRDIYVPRSVAYGSYNPEKTKSKKGTNKMENTVKINRKVTLTPEYNFMTRKAMCEQVMQNAYAIGYKKIALIDVGLLNIPPYQREQRTHVYRIAENWDDHECDVVKVSYDRLFPCFNVINGQHRCSAAKMRGIKFVVCEIETGMNTSSEARMFVTENTNSKRLNPFDEYKANQFIADEDDNDLSRLDKRIAKVCDDYNITVKQSQGCGVLKTVPHARKIMKREGEDGLSFIFEVIQDSHWDKFPNGYSYVVMEALRKIYNVHNDDLDAVKRKLVSKLSTSSPREIESIGNGRYPNLGRTARWDAVLSEIAD